MSGPPVVAFDIGGTHLRSALVDGDGRIAGRRDRPTPVHSADALCAAIVDEARAHAAAATQAPGAVGIAMAGYTDTRTGTVYDSPSLGLAHAVIGPPIAAALGLPVRLVNDVNAAAWGEAQHCGARDLVAVLVGTGVGAGFVSGGALLEGHHGMAAEGGHAIWREDGLPCACGRRGCYQAYLGGKALALRARDAGLPASTATLLQRWREGDAAAGTIMLDAQAALASLCVLLVTLLDPERIVIAGGVARHAPELLAAARAAVDPHPLSAHAGAVLVQEAALGDRAGLLGAASLAQALLREGMLPRR